MRSMESEYKHFSLYLLCRAVYANADTQCNVIVIIVVIVIDVLQAAA